VKLAVISATAIVVFGYVITRLFPKQIISIFNRDPELIKFGSYGLISWFLCMPVVGFQIIASNFFQAIGKYRSAMFLTLTRQVIFLIPALIIFPKFWGINGLLHAAPFADFFSALLTGIWFFYGIKAMSANLAEGIK
jgi:Na+-driven multidrug efflux pump